MPIIIINENKLFITKEFYDKFEYTWKCKYYLRIKENLWVQNFFYSSAIKVFKYDIITNKISIYLDVNHPEIYKKLFSNTSRVKKNTERRKKI